jgi:hypothetical protein
VLYGITSSIIVLKAPLVSFLMHLNLVQPQPHSFYVHMNVKVYLFSGFAQIVSNKIKANILTV